MRSPQENPRDNIVLGKRLDGYPWDTLRLHGLMNKNVYILLTRPEYSNLEVATVVQFNEFKGSNDFSSGL